MRRDELCVEELIPARLQSFDEMDQSDLRGIQLAAKHRLTKKRSSNRYSIQAANELILFPSFHTVGKSKTVEGKVALDNVLRNPRLFAIGAGAHNELELFVDPDVKMVSLDRPPEASRNFEHLQLKDGSWIGRVPTDFLRPRIRHREIPTTVRSVEKLRLNNSRYGLTRSQRVIG